MTDKEYAAAKKRLNKLLSTWVHRLGLAWWSVKATYSRKPLISDYDTKDPWQALANSDIQWPYRQAYINFDTERCAALNDADLEDTVIHELSHILINEMREWDDNNLENSVKHEESVVTALAKAFHWTAKDASNKK